MDITVRHIDELVVLALYYQGPFEQLGENMAVLQSFAKEHNISYTTMMTRVHSLEKLEMDICLVISAPIDVPKTDLNLKLDVICGKFAVHALHGSYDLLPETWREFCSQIPAQGYTIRDGPPFEIYVSLGCESVAESIPHTDLYMPIA